MHKKFLQFLIDPATKEDLQVTVIDSIGENIITGSLYSSSNNYQIENCNKIIKNQEDRFNASTD